MGRVKIIQVVCVFKSDSLFRAFFWLANLFEHILSTLLSDHFFEPFFERATPMSTFLSTLLSNPLSWALFWATNSYERFFENYFEQINSFEPIFEHSKEWVCSKKPFFEWVYSFECFFEHFFEHSSSPATFMVWGRSKPLLGWFGALCLLLEPYNPSKSARKKCPRVPVWVRGGGSNCYLGNAQINWDFCYVGFPYHTSPSILSFMKYNFHSYFLHFTFFHKTLVKPPFSYFRLSPAPLNFSCFRRTWNGWDEPL